MQKLNGHEPVSSEMSERDLRGVDDDIVELIEILASSTAPDEDTLENRCNFNKGLDFEWDKDPAEVRFFSPS